MIQPHRAHINLSFCVFHYIHSGDSLVRCRFLVSSIIWVIVFALIRIALRPLLDNKRQWDSVVYYFVAFRWTFWSGAGMWPLTFWTLSALIGSRGSSTLNKVLWRLHLFLGTHFGPGGIRFPGFTLGPKWAAVLIYGRMLYTASSYCQLPGFVGLVVAVFNLRHFMYPYNEYFDLTWACAWWLLFTACVYAMAPGMQLSWYGMWYGIMAATAFLIRPDQSKARFVSWAVIIFVLRAVIYTLYATWLTKDLNIAFLSSNHFVQTWRMSSSSVWYPLSSRDPTLQDHPTLCERCDRMTAKSGLIMGSSLYFTKLVEWHTYWSRKELCFAFREEDLSNQPNINSSEFDAKRCGLCSLLWHSMSLKRRENIIASTIGEGVASTISPDLSLPINANEELRVKIWEERPLSLYTYAQLYWGEVAIGARLLIHRQKLFAGCESSLFA